MNTNCPCGGRFKRSDIVLAGYTTNGLPQYADRDIKVAHWKCDKCGTQREQRKRQGKLKH